MSEEFLASDANLIALADLHRALSSAYEAAFPGQVAETPRAAIGALVMEIGRMRDDNDSLRRLNIGMPQEMDRLLARITTLQTERDYWRVQAQDTLVDLHEQAVELDAARAVVEAVRASVYRETAYLPIEKADTLALGRVLDALRAYDETVKVRQ